MELDLAAPIESAECWRLLGSVSFGRLGLSVRALPAIIPVQFYRDGDNLAICLGHHGIPATSLNDTVVAFAADAIGDDRSGWEVQVLGRVRVPLRLGTATDCGQPPAGRVVLLEPTTIVGHRVHLCPFLAHADAPDAEA